MSPLPVLLSFAATEVRQFLTGEWPRWHQERGNPVPKILSAATCGRSSAFLQRVITEDCGLPATIGCGTFGLLKKHDWISHFWVECDGWIVDVTADQFKAAAVIVTTSDDPRYHKIDDPALAFYRQERALAAARSWPRWQASDQRRRLQHRRATRTANCPKSRQGSAPSI